MVEKEKDMVERLRFKDIVERLRFLVEDETGAINRERWEAADEIERLRTDVDLWERRANEWRTTANRYAALGQERGEESHPADDLYEAYKKYDDV